MLGLVNEVLEVFQAEGEEIPLRRVVLDPAPLLAAAGEAVAIAAGQKGIELEVAIPAPLPAIDADPDRLTRALENLLSNAVKFTPAGGRIVLEARAIPGTGVEQGLTLLLVSVTDTGEGIPAADLPYVFDPYRQGADRKRGGVGLGLSIVRRIVAAHGGNVSVRSQVGVGSSFSVVLPTADAAGGSPRA